MKGMVLQEDTAVISTLTKHWDSQIIKPTLLDIKGQIGPDTTQQVLSFPDSYL